MDSTKKILLLGSGLCTPAMIKYLNSHNYYLTIATRTPNKADVTIAKCQNPNLIKTVKLDFEDKEIDAKLNDLIKDHDLVISMLPYVFHVTAAKIAIQLKKHFCTTSYISPQMQELNQSAIDAGIIMLNECGVDPGLDHMSACQFIDNCGEQGIKIEEFYSICGGLPSVSANDNPYGYKFSWAPRGVLLASRNSAKIWKDSKVVDVPGIDLFDSKNVVKENIEQIGDLEWYYNRDSFMFIDLYNKPALEGIKVMIRGTYRYPGWCRTIKLLADLKLNSDEPISWITGQTYAEFMRKKVGANEGESAREAISRVCPDHDNNEAAYKQALDNFEWIGLFDEKNPIPENINNSLDALCVVFQNKLYYKPGQKDMIIMKHKFILSYPNGERKMANVLLHDEGLQNSNDKNWDDSDSSMNRTVGLPMACAARLILEGKITKTGICRPITKDLYEPILLEMEKVGVKFIEQFEE